MHRCFACMASRSRQPYPATLGFTGANLAWGRLQEAEFLASRQPRRATCQSLIACRASQPYQIVPCAATCAGRRPQRLCQLPWLPQGLHRQCDPAGGKGDTTGLYDGAEGARGGAQCALSSKTPPCRCRQLLCPRCPGPRLLPQPWNPCSPLCSARRRQSSPLMPDSSGWWSRGASCTACARCSAPASGWGSTRLARPSWPKCCRLGHPPWWLQHSPSSGGHRESRGRGAWWAKASDGVE